jgi:hypothetical protein
MKKILIAAGIFVGVIVLLIAASNIRFKINKPADSGTEKSSNGEVSSGQVKWKEYKSASFGYKVSLPQAWTAKEQTGEGGGPDILFSEPQGLAFVRVRGLYDSQINSPEAIKASIDEYKNSFASQGETLTNFKTGEVQNNVGGFFAFGEFKINDISYRFEERGLLATNGKVLIFRASAIPQAYDATIPLMQKIMTSFTNE